MIISRVIFPVVLSLIGITAAPAQTPPQSAPQAADTQASLQETVPPPALVEILTAAKNITKLPVNEAVQLDMSLLNIPGGANDLAAGVTVNAYGRSVELQGRKIGQLVLTGVRKGRKTEALNSTAFTSQFDLSDDAKLQPDQPVKVMGNASELIAALQRLQDASEDREEKKERKTVANDSPQSGSTGESRNRDAAGYSTPQVTKTGKKDPVESTRVSQDGCKIKIDLAQGVARETARLITTKDGAVTKESKCAPSGTDYKIRKSYPSCAEDKIDLEAMKATARYINYYLDSGGKRTDIGECQDDSELIFDIVEKHKCMVSPDYAAQRVIFQSKLVYSNQNNQEIQVRDCAESKEKPPVPMVKSTAGCSIRHDFPKNKSFRQSMWTYIAEGVRYQVGSCVDDGTEYPHTKVYKDNSGYICKFINDGSTITFQYRMQITIDQLNQFVTECAPDATSVAVSSTTQGCDDPGKWTHNLSSGQSIGQVQFFFVRDGKRESLGGCQDTTTTYPHQVETTGYTHYDDQMLSYPKSTVYITPPTGRYNIVRDRVLDGAQQVTYTYDRIDEVASGGASYDGCEKSQNYSRVKVWRRADGTSYYETLSPVSSSPVNACQTVLSAWRFVLGRRSCDTHYYNRGEDYVYRIDESCTYSITRSVRRDDGWLMSGPTTKSATISDTVNSWSHSCVLVPRCEVSPDATWAAARLSEWGW